MSTTSPPPEAQRFGRSQTPESPRPVHIPEPANIPVLLNQMDPVFNDTATYNIPNNQTFSPFPDPTSEQGAQNSVVDEHDAVQNFFREAEHQAAAEPEPSVNTIQNTLHATSNTSTEANPFPSVPPFSDPSGQIAQDANVAITPPMADPLLETSITESTATNQTDAPAETSAAQNPSVGEQMAEQAQIRPQQSEQQTLISHPEGGIDYQSLLDTIAQSASTAPIADSLTAPTTTASNVEDVGRPLPSVPGLPPKPPPQEHPIEFPSYSSYDNSVQGLKLDTTGNSSNATVVPNGGDVQQAGLSDAGNQQNTIPQLYPSLQAFGAYGQVPPSTTTQLPLVQNQPAPGQDVGRNQNPSERPWSPKTQSLYDQFLENERRYVTEGIWDRFPTGSRLFVGNLPSEKVTKRDLFHKFHKHGQLAQISIKQAYGFVQFLEAASCLAALNAEQGVEIRGRKVHLEVSKPQKNTRNSGGGGGGGGGAGGGGGGSKNQQRRRSRSPDRGGRRDNRNYSDFRDEPGRRRDEFRNRRSPSPRGYRQRDDYRPGGREGRSRSPFYGTTFGSPSVPAVDDEASLQLPRRDPRQVPDVQLLVLEPEVVQSFINWVEQGFRNKGLQAATIWVNNRLPLPAVIKRQIIEGVQAVVKLTRASQNNSKIPLQVFDRSAGASNVNFNEYVDLDISIAADVVLQARQKERGGVAAQTFRPPTFPTQNYQPSIPYGSPQPPVPYPQQTPPQYPYPTPQQNAYRPPTQPTTPTSQPPNLQQLLANLRQPPAQPNSQGFPGPVQNGQPTNLSGFLGNVGAPQLYPQAQQTTYGQYNAGSSQQGGQQPNVHNIMEQLARYQR